MKLVWGSRSLRAILLGGVIIVITIIGLMIVKPLLLGAQDETWDKIQSTRVLRICLDATFAPFESVDENGNLAGFDVDLARSLGSEWLAQVQFVQVHFDGLYDALKAGKCELIISALPYDSTMTRDVLYSESYLELGQVLLTSNQAGGVQSWRDLDGRTVAVELGSEAHQLVRQLVRDTGQEIEITAERVSIQALDDLLDGRAQALVVDSTTALGYLNQYPALSQVDDMRDPVPLVIAARQKAGKTIEEVDLVLNRLRADGKMDELKARWF